jgi:hypothetical protein
MEVFLMDTSEKYKYAIENQQKLFDYVYNGNLRLEEKGRAILESSSIIIGLVAAGSLASQETTTSQAAVYSLLIIVILFVAIVLLTLYAWLPKVKTYPHKANWENIFEKYIYADEEAHTNAFRLCQRHKQSC